MEYLIKFLQAQWFGSIRPCLEDIPYLLLVIIALYLLGPFILKFIFLIDALIYKIKKSKKTKQELASEQKRETYRILEGFLKSSEIFHIVSLDDICFKLGVLFNLFEFDEDDCCDTFSVNNLSTEEQKLLYALIMDDIQKPDYQQAFINLHQFVEACKNNSENPMTIFERQAIKEILANIKIALHVQPGACNDCLMNLLEKEKERWCLWKK